MNISNLEVPPPQDQRALVDATDKDAEVRVSSWNDIETILTAHTAVPVAETSEQEISCQTLSRISGPPSHSWKMPVVFSSKCKGLVRGRCAKRECRHVCVYFCLCRIASLNLLEKLWYSPP